MNFVKNLSQISEKFNHTFFVPGNHEYYTEFSMSTVNGAIFDACEAARVTSLLRESFRFTNMPVVIHGCTLWSDISPKAYRSMRDSKFVTFEQYEKQHQGDVKFLETALADDKFKGCDNVVLTHHLPSFRLTHPRFMPHSGFASHLDSLISQSRLWMCGHTHERVEIYNPTTKILKACANPIGYVDEKKETVFSFEPVYSCAI